MIAWRRFEAMPKDDPLPWLLGTARRVLSNQRRGAAQDVGGSNPAVPLGRRALAALGAGAAWFAHWYDDAVGGGRVGRGW